MRWLLRFLLFWALMAPISYFFGVPLMLDYLNQKTRTQSFDQCLAHMNSERLIGSPNSPFTAEQGQTYCHCVSDGLTLNKSDLIDILQKKQPTTLTAYSTKQVETCNKQLQQQAYTAPAAPAQPTPPAATDGFGVTN